MLSNIMFPVVLVVLWSASRNVIMAENPLVMHQTKEVLRLLKAPSDNDFQRDIKAIIATYLVEATYLEDEEPQGGKGRYEALPIPYGKHKHHSQSQRDRYDELLQKLQEQEKQLQQIKQTGAVPAAPVVAPPVPAIQQAKQEPVAPVVQTPAPVITTVPEQKVETATQIPVILTTPATSVIAATQAAVPVAQTEATTTKAPASTRPTVDPVHHLNQVNKILGNVANGNIVGIVDESLAIRAPPPVRNLVTNIMKVIFCNPIDRLFGRCAPNQIDAANNSVKGK